MLLPDPDRDLVFEALLAAPPSAIWRAWTEPDLLCRWFCPPPWRLRAARIDPWPGGRFETEMEGPEGQIEEGPGCVLLAEPARRLVLCDALGAGFRPTGRAFVTIALAFDPAPEATPDAPATRYRAHLLHATPEDRARHAQMGFDDGWTIATRQLEATARSLATP
jgi:uncharacterized protein YndB with AHSA1/START domain